MTTFEEMEYSAAAGAPIELYEFVRGVWSMYVTSDATAYSETPSKVFVPAAIERGRLRQGQDTLKDTIVLTVPRSDDLANEFLVLPPEDSTSVTIKKQHRGLATSEAVVLWKGRVIGARAAGEKVEIECESIFTSIKRLGLREKTERICQHALYSTGCAVNQPLYRVNDDIAGVDGATVTMQAISTYGDGYFTGGILEYLGDRRMIIKQVGNVLTLSRPMDVLVVQMTVALYPGCDHTWATCVTKFNNVVNFKGFPWIPARNPFSQSLK